MQKKSIAEKKSWNSAVGTGVLKIARSNVTKKVILLSKNLTKYIFGHYQI